MCVCGVVWCVCDGGYVVWCVCVYMCGMVCVECVYVWYVYVYEVVAVRCVYTCTRVQTRMTAVSDV